MNSIRSENIFSLKGHFGSVYSIVSAGKHWFFSGSGDKHIVKWNLESGQHENFSVSLPFAVYSLAFDASRNFLYAGNGQGQVHFIDLEKKSEQRCLQLTRAILFDLLLFEAGGILLAASGDGWVHAIEQETGLVLWAKKLSEQKVRQLRVLQPEESFVAALGDGRFIGLSIDGRVLFEIMAHKDSCNTLMPITDENLIYSGGKDAHLQLYELSSLKLLESIPAHNFALYDLALHPNKKFLASCSRDKTIKIWDPKTAKFLLRIENPNQGGHSHSVNRLLWTGFQEMLISGGDDRQLMVRKIVE